MAWTTPRTWVAGEKPTAATLNTHIRDNLAAIGDPWTAYTPSWTGATTNPVIGNGTIVGAYMLTGKLCHFRAIITMGSTTTYGSGQWRLSLPATPKGGYRWRMQGEAQDASPAGAYPIVGIYDTSITTMALACASLTAGGADRSVGGAAPQTWATSDVLTIHGTFEVA